MNVISGLINGEKLFEVTRHESLLYTSRLTSRDMKAYYILQDSRQLQLYAMQL